MTTQVTLQNIKTEASVFDEVLFWIEKRNLCGGFLTTTLRPGAVEDSGWLTSKL